MRTYCGGGEMTRCYMNVWVPSSPRKARCSSECLCGSSAPVGEGRPRQGRPAHTGGSNEALSAARQTSKDLHSRLFSLQKYTYEDKNAYRITHVDTRVHRHTRTHTHVYTHIHKYKHTYRWVHTNTHVYTQTYTYIHVHTQRDAYTKTHAHTNGLPFRKFCSVTGLRSSSWSERERRRKVPGSLYLV